AVGRYLRLADLWLPGRVTGWYLVGSLALDAFRPGRSDVDFVAVLDRELSPGELRRLRVVHASAGLVNAAAAGIRRQPLLSGTCNGVFVRQKDLTRPVLEITPVASHAGHEFHVGRGFDANPVTWKVLAERGIPIRGDAPAMLGLKPSPEQLRGWNLANLHEYWQPWAERLIQQGPVPVARLRPRWMTAWGVLGAPRLHHTIATGEVISKPAAGEYALATFSGRWHAIISEGLGYWHGTPADPAFRSLELRARATAEFVLEVVRTAEAL
ncbi:MAG: DUF4111 domain-containing protein, partial [Acidimicrobiaceae bacterium]|nr:DUF4111 domain-containing protein [Acidimicrobiaceae bacterium]